MSRRALLVLFAVAFAARLAHLAAQSHLVWFDTPLVDAANYLRTARLIAAGDLLAGREAFWQPPLYPYCLALLLRLFGGRLAFALVAQSVLGAATCVVAGRTAARLWGGKAGLASGLVLALYGPLVHFDTQPLIPVLHVALVVLGLHFLVGALLEPSADAAGVRRLAWAGLSWGLAAIATPNILCAAPATLALLALRPRAGGEPAGMAPRRRAAGVAAWSLCLAAPVLLVAARNLVVAGEPVLISSNGGINFYLGNNADYDRTIRIRPGGDFERLAQEPENLGILGAAERSRWFTRRALAFWTDYPGPAARLMLRKTRDLLAGREIPRNENIYDSRRDSRLLRVLLFRAGVSFPFGVIAPLALAGALLAWRGAAAGSECTAILLLLVTAAAYAASIVLFFPTDRYRLPLVPIAALFAGRLLAEPRALRRPVVAAALAAGLLLFNLDAATPTESYPEEEALNRAYALRAHGRLEEARQEYLRAVALNPDRIDAPNALAVMAAERGDWEEAVARYRQVLLLAPDFIDVRRSLGEALLAIGRRDEAREEWLTASRMAPAAGLALADLALLSLEEGAIEPAHAYAGRAVAARPDLPETHMALGLAARALRRRDQALLELAAAERLFPDGSAGKSRARDLLDRMRRRDAPHDAGP